MSGGDGIAAIVALGNPGDKHARDRHNAGFWLADRLVEHGAAPFRAEKRFHGELTQYGPPGREVRVLKPDTFMNRSGQAVQALMAYYRFKPAQVLVVHDELDLPPGTARLKRGGGHGGHNGLRDCIGHVGAEFARLRLGIGHPGRKEEVLNFVLGRPSIDEQASIDDAIARSIDAIDILLDQGWQRAVQSLHSATGEPSPDN